MKEKLKYGLEDHVPKGEFFVYTLQHIIYFAAGTVVLPIAVGIHLGLEQIQIAELLQRTFFLCGVTTLLQIKLGHLYPIIDGPAGLWASMMIVMAVSTADMGGQMGDLRRNLELGILIAGTIIMVFGGNWPDAETIPALYADCKWPHHYADGPTDERHVYERRTGDR